MNILLLNPIPLYETWPIPNDFWRCFTRVASCTFPQLASMVPGENVRILDGLVERVDLASYARILASTDIIGLSAVSAVTALNTEITIKFIKRLNPKATIVLGGHHASAYPLEWLSRGADIIINMKEKKPSVNLLCV
ncbi:MAG TPA: cobalamin B12-binding domain-containing protein [Candidatus Omnitrophota bacterium]|nr:cobalamin B12-binding domain-containing protein [Candidatus Omnitrophota bacterium]